MKTSAIQLPGIRAGASAGLVPRKPPSPGPKPADTPGEQGGRSDVPHAGRGPSRPEPWRRVARILLTVMCLTLLPALHGCDGRNADTGDETQFVKSATDGPVDVMLIVAADRLALDTPAEARVEVIADRGVTVEVENFRQALAASEKRYEYQVIQVAEETAKPIDGGRLRWSYRYRLEFFLPGEFELPPARVKYLPSPDGAASRPDAQEATNTLPGPDDAWRDVATEPLTITVLDTRAAPPTEEELRNVATLDPVDLPGVWSRWWWLGLLLAAVLVAVVVLLTRSVARRRIVLAPPIPADVWARRQIAALLAEDLIGKRRIQEFYYRLSHIVRGYIERRFAVSAPEMTTEEFLLTASADRRFDRRHTEQLDRFLGACDLVKYACHQPGSGEIDGMLNEAKRFIEDTRERIAPDGRHAPPAGAVQERAA